MPNQCQVTSDVQILDSSVDLPRHACAADPTHLVAGMSLAEALFAAGQHQAAFDQAQLTLERIDLCPTLSQKAQLFCRSTAYTT